MGIERFRSNLQTLFKDYGGEMTSVILEYLLGYRICIDYDFEKMKCKKWEER